MKRVLVILLFLISSKALLAEHITGGEIFYTFLSNNNGEFQYRITLKLFRHCGPTGADLDPSAAIGIFNKTTMTLRSVTLVPMKGSKTTLQLTTPGPCITNPPDVCYEVGVYEFDVSLPASILGYIVSYQRCCRINGINNLNGSSNTGATYTADIPGTSILATAPQNSSAQFAALDTVIVCGGYPFTYSFGAVDPDGDQLRYSFCDAYLGGNSSSGGAAPNPPANPPYTPVSYSSPYNGGAPLGPNAFINPVTGLITGTSPPEGIYVVTVCVQEIRNGFVIATQRKDVQVKAGGCAMATPQLEPKYVTCDGLSYSFTHPSNPLINTFYWTFGDPASGANNISTDQNPSHLFTVPGDYTIKLVTNKNQDCSDSATATIGVWPGFTPDFTTGGVCVTNPVVFHDASTTVYGVVNSWNWALGDETSTGDIAVSKDTSWKYSTIGPKDVTLIVTNSKGCTATVTKTVTIIDKPEITVAFKDTLICVPDAVTLQASGTGNFTWTPAVAIVNANSGTPTVNPTSTITYHVQLDQLGCINTDTVRVRVVNFVTLNEMRDTTICETDEVQLHISSDGLHYQWTPSAALNDGTVQNPIAISGASQLYTVTAFIGSCMATKDIQVTAAPYPVVNAGLDTSICYATPAFLHGTHDGQTFNWSPTSSLMNANTLNPTAYPPKPGFTDYVLTSFHTGAGTCPKPRRDTVTVRMMPKIKAFAGNDTLVIVNQPLQFNAEGGVTYLWSPASYLTAIDIHNPVGTYGAEVDTITYHVNVYDSLGCFDTTSVKVTVFKTNPYVFVPTAFTPNGDGLNDLIMPIAVGVQKINYFSIFNRWGQLVFKTTVNGHGWDGKIGGVAQASNVYVWMVNATDYLGKPIFLKGTVTLIR